LKAKNDAEINELHGRLSQLLRDDELNRSTIGQLEKIIENVIFVDPATKYV
jgi:hypothetical protein